MESRIKGRIPSCDEAHQILLRFIHSHFDESKKEHARFSIPVDFNRDDDVLLSNFIEWARQKDFDAEVLSGNLEGCGSNE